MTFFAHIAQKAYNYQKSTLKSYTWYGFKKTVIFAPAAQAIIDELEQGGVPFDEQANAGFDIELGKKNYAPEYTPNPNNKHALAYALFKLALERDLDATNNALYLEIWHSDSYDHILDTEKETFFAQICTILKEHVEKYKTNAQLIPNPEYLINDIYFITNHLFSIFKEDKQKKQIELIQASGFFETVIKPGLVLEGEIFIRNMKMFPQLASLPYKENRTILQEYAQNYAVTKNVDIKNLIVTLLSWQSKNKEDISISVAHENDSLWIETLIKHLDDIAAWDNIIEDIKPAMYDEFFKRKLHETLCNKLLEKITKEDYWTKTLEEHRASGNTVLFKLIDKIIKDKNEVLDDRIRLYGENFIRFSIRKMDAKLIISDPVDAIYQISNAIKNAIESTLGGYALSIMSVSIDSVLRLNEAHKQEIRFSIEKSLQHLEENIKIYPDPQKAIQKFTSVSRDILNALKPYHLDLQEIIYNCPNSLNTIKNIATVLSIYIIEDKGIDDVDGFYQSEFYKKSGAPQVPEGRNDNVITDYLNNISELVTSYRSNPIRLYKADNEINRNCTTFLQREVVDIYQPLFTRNASYLAIKAVLQIIDYRIISYTQGDKYEKGFYNDYLRQIKYQNFYQPLSAYIPFVIAQINMSLKKIKYEHYQAPERAKALVEYLGECKMFWCIQSDALDLHAQELMFDLVVINSGFVNVQSADNRSFLRQFYKMNAEGKIRDGEISTQDVKKFIGLFVIYFDDYDRVVEFFEHNISQIFRINRDGFDASEYYLISVHAIHHDLFIPIWAALIRFNLTDVVKFEHRHFIIHAGINPNPIRAYELLFPGNDFGPNKKILPLLLSTPIYSISCLLTTQIRQQLQKKHILHSSDDAFNNNTFNYAKWYALYNIDKSIIVTPLQYLAFQFLAGNMGSTPLTIISRIMQQDVQLDFHLEDRTYGSWLDILLVGLHYTHADGDFSPETTECISKIASYMSGERAVNFFTKEYRNKTIDRLIAEMNPMADSEHDSYIYGLCLTFIVSTFFYRDISKDIDFDDVLIKKIASLILAYASFESTKKQMSIEQYLVDSVGYSTGNNTTVILKKMKSLVETGEVYIDPKTLSFTTHISFKNDTREYQLARKVCVTIKESLFLLLNKGPNIAHSEYLRLQDKILDCKNGTPLSSAARTAIYQSIEKTIQSMLRIGGDQWRNIEYIEQFFQILFEITQLVDLEFKPCIKGNAKIVLDRYRWAFLFKNRSTLVYTGMVSDVSFTNDVYSVFNNEGFKSLITVFVNDIIRKARDYNKKPWKPNNTHNTACAQLIESLKDQGKPSAFIKSMIAIIHYRLKSYTEVIYEKSFYLECLSSPLDSLSAIMKENNLTDHFTDFYKNSFFDEICAVLQEIGAENIRNRSKECRGSFAQSLDLFIKILHLEEQFKNFNYRQYGLKVELNESASSSTVITSSQACNMNNNNNSDDTSNHLSQKSAVETNKM